MKNFLFLSALLFALPYDAQTPDNTAPGTTTPANTNLVPQPPVQTGTFYTNPPAPPAANPTGVNGTDMTNPNVNGSFESNPDQKPRDNFQSQPNIAPNTRSPQNGTRLK